METPRFINGICFSCYRLCRRVHYYPHFFHCVSCYNPYTAVIFILILSRTGVDLDSQWELAQIICIGRNMYYKTYAYLKNNMQVPRLEKLVKALEAQHCRVKLNMTDMRLELEIPDEQVWWVITGCITVFFERFRDVASWSFRFQPSSLPDTLAA
jgi:hypothetical protein